MRMEVGIRHRAEPLQMMCVVTLTYAFKVTKFEILKLARASEKCSSLTCVEVGICHRNGPSRLVYSITLTFIFKVKHFVTHFL